VELTLQAAMPWRQRLKAWLEMPLVQHSLIALILVNAVILGLETSSTVMANFFLPFILASTFTLLNLFIAVIVNAIHQKHGGEARPSADQELAQLRLEIAALRNDLRTVRAPFSGARRRG
jgi:hypothetical protein